VHVMFLLGVRNRLSVILGWVWSYFTFDVGVRLITDEGLAGYHRAISARIDPIIAAQIRNPDGSRRGPVVMDRSTSRGILRPPIVPSGARHRELHGSGRAAVHRRSHSRPIEIIDRP
jgi:hypothetical protein